MRSMRPVRAMEWCGAAAAIAGLSTAAAAASGVAFGGSVPGTPEPASSPVAVGRGGLISAVESLASGSADRARARGTLLWRLRHSPACFPADLTEEEFERVLIETGLFPPTFDSDPRWPADRYYTDSFVWVGDGNLGSSNRAQRASLTYSFPPDGTLWGLSSTTFTGPNTLNASLVTTFGSEERGREYIRAALASWRRYAGLSYTQVADDGGQMNGDPERTPLRGDFRIGGFNFAASPNGLLAYNGFPSSLGGASVTGGDMALNTSYFTPGGFALAISDYRYFRNTCAHEHGHGLGCIHSIPCDRTKLMEPTISQDFNMVQRDEIRAAQRNYGDRFAGNHSHPNARDFGNLTSPAIRSVLAKDLSTNGSPAPLFTGEDWFRFTLSSAQPVTISVTPTGGPGIQGEQQVAGCSGTTTTVDSLIAGNLEVDIRSPANTNVALFASTAGGPGVVETITIPSLAAGTYLVKVRDGGAPNSAANQHVQAYDLLIRLGTVKAPPEAIAGLNKRVPAGVASYFLGGVNSRATEAGANISPVGYDWDLDGDGVIETEDDPNPSLVYPSNGVFPVTLHVTDTNNKTAIDTIMVTVFGATTTVSSVAPGDAPPGTSVPVVIYGTNFKGVTSASQVTLSGSGLGVVGTPSINGLGTEISGLSFVIAAGASQTARSVTVTNSDGMGASGTGIALFTVGTPGAPPGNDECDGAETWTGENGPKVFTNSSATRSASQNFTGTGCPASGPIENDVWYAWTAPTRGNVMVTTDSAAAGFQTRVAAYRASAGCPPPAATPAVRCDDFGVSFSLPVTTGGQYLFQVGSVALGATGTANVILNLIPTLGSCCSPTGSCTVTSDAACDGIDWLVAGTCNPNVCPRPLGACCSSAGCTITDSEECLTIPGVWQGADTDCGGPGNPIACCRANFNQLDGLTIQDLFDYLNAWFAFAPGSDFNGVGGVTVQDLFDYLGAYFAGCAG